MQEGDVEKIVQKGEWGMRDAEGLCVGRTLNEPDMGSLKQMEIGKTYTQGTDRKGRPVVYIHVAKHKLFDQSAKALEDFVIFQMENVRYLLADRADKVTMGASLSRATALTLSLQHDGASLATDATDHRRALVSPTWTGSASSLSSSASRCVRHVETAPDPIRRTTPSRSTA